MTCLEIIVGTFNDGLWTFVVPWLLVGAGIFFAFRTALVQLRMIPSMFTSVVERPKGTGADADEGYGGISAFKAFTISAASRVGTGNVACVAVAVFVGGSGVDLWMWISSIVGGVTVFIAS